MCENRSTPVAKVVFERLTKPGSAKAAARGVGKKRVATADGGWETVWTVDAHSPTLDDDLLYVFRRNVAKARRENKRLLGVTDFVPPKR
jgi:hypothetical protein